MRLFVAINVPPAVRDALFADAASLRAATDAVKWVPAPSLHVTLKFVGELAELVVGGLQQAVAHAASGHGRFDVETTAFGAFPNFRRPRVVWVGMTGESKLRALAADVDRACLPFGIAAESRVFQAHLTLGRARRELRPPEAAAMADAAARTRPRRAFPVRTIDLMRSELGPGGSRYSVLAAAPLHP